MSRHPRSVPYRSTSELETLYSWFYDVEGETLKALSLVNTYETRGHVPYGVECTALLASAILQDSDCKAICLATQLAYSSAIIRFVNGFLDQHQTAQYAMPLHALALKIGMPTMFVELRHACTHERLPSLEVLRYGAEHAMGWLKERYWVPELERIRNEERMGSQRILELIEKWIKRNAQENTDDDDEDSPELEVSQRDFGLARYQESDKSPEAVAYWRLLSSIESVSTFEEDAFCAIGIPMILAHGVSATNSGSASLSSIRIFSPVLQRMRATIVDGLLNKCLETVVSSYKNKSDGVYIPSLASAPADSSVIYLGRDKAEDPALSHAKNWLRHVLTHPRQSSDSSDKKSAGFSISYRKFVLTCLRFSAPSPTLLSFLKLAKNNYGTIKEQSLAVLINSFEAQVELLYGGKADSRTERSVNKSNVDSLPEVASKPKPAPVLTETGADSLPKVASKPKPAPVLTETGALNISPWELLKGPWTPSPIGAL